MSFTGKGYEKSISEQIFTQQNLLNNKIYPEITNNKCRGYTGFYPSFKPVLENLSITNSLAGAYSLVYVTGSNFLPNGSTYIKFGSLGNIPVTYYSSTNLSFVVPLNAIAGNYNVHVVNIYNGNFSPQINQSYQGNPNYSNSLIYTIR